MSPTNGWKEPDKHETDPAKIAKKLIHQHNLKPDVDESGDTYEVIWNLVTEAVAPLSNAELGEVISYGDHYCDVVEFANNIVWERLPDPDNPSFRGLQEHTATYIVNVAVHQALGTGEY